MTSSLGCHFHTPLNRLCVCDGQSGTTIGLATSALIFSVVREQVKGGSETAELQSISCETVVASGVMVGVFLGLIRLSPSCVVAYQEFFIKYGSINIL